MKTCTICKQDKEITQFNKKKTSKDGLQTQCRDCSKKEFNKYYNLNKEKHLKTVKVNSTKYSKRNVDRVNLIKGQFGCTLCNEIDVCCLEFHHMNGALKEATIADLTHRGYSWSKISLEIKKCACVCSNCHRKIHAGKKMVSEINLISISDDLQSQLNEIL